MRVAIIGHGRSPEGKSWGPLIDECVVVRMWDHAWQDPADYGDRYDYGLFEVHPSMMPTFHENNVRQPSIGWVGSVLSRPDRCRLPDRTELINQADWNALGKEMGGIGATGNLQFTRGTIAACWAIERLEAEAVVLVGFDNIEAGVTLDMEDAFSPAYRANPGTFPFDRYKGGETKHGNHDFTIELPVMRHLADKHGVDLVTAAQIWS